MEIGGKKTCRNTRIKGPKEPLSLLVVRGVLILSGRPEKS